MERNCDKIDYQFLQASRYRHPRELILYEIYRKEKVFLKNVFCFIFCYCCAYYNLWHAVFHHEKPKIERQYFFYLSFGI